MKKLWRIYHNGDWICPYCEELNSTEEPVKIVQCAWCEGESILSSAAMGIFQHDLTGSNSKQKLKL